MLIEMTFSSYISWDNEDEIISEEDTIAVDNIETVEHRRAISEAQQKERIVVPCIKKQICSGGRCER